MALSVYQEKEEKNLYDLIDTFDKRFSISPPIILPQITISSPIISPPIISSKSIPSDRSSLMEWGNPQIKYSYYVSGNCDNQCINCDSPFCCKDGLKNSLKI